MTNCGFKHDPTQLYSQAWKNKHWLLFTVFTLPDLIKLDPWNKNETGYFYFEGMSFLFI